MKPYYNKIDLNLVTCEKGSSSELGKSYWLRSLGLNTEGPECWGADRGGILGFFSYFLLVRTASVFSGCKQGRETMLSVYASFCVIKKAFQGAKQQVWCWWSMYRRRVRVETTVSKRGIDMQMAACARCHCRARWLSPSSSFSIQLVPPLTPTSPVGRPLPVWTDSNPTRISQSLFSP